MNQQGSHLVFPVCLTRSITGTACDSRCVFEELEIRRPRSDVCTLNSHWPLEPCHLLLRFMCLLKVGWHYNVFFPSFFKQCLNTLGQIEKRTARFLDLLDLQIRQKEKNAAQTVLPSGQCLSAPVS